MLACVTFIVLLIFKPITHKPMVVNLITGEMKLVAVTVLFRHGARAPVVIENATIAAMFPNGPGEITDVGLTDTFKLGQLLGDRYVKTGFLRTPLLPSEIYFRSRANNRCLFCAGIVGSGMWAKNENSQFTPVPIYAQEKNDNLLEHLQGCPVETSRINKKCGKMPPAHVSWPVYEGFIFECIGLLKNNSDLFPTAEAFSKVESLVQMDRNGLPMPEWFNRNRKRIYELYEKVYHFTVSVADYHDREILKLKQGYLMNRIIDDLWKQWREYERNGSVQRKFTAYSTQDWLILAFLHSLGCGEEALGTTIPDFNALVIIELYEQMKKPMIRIYYKDNNMRAPKDITHAVRSCSFAPCHLIQFILSGKRYRTDDPKSVCNLRSI
ncbi:histidine acid phosphatase [Ancylostoma caninum]|uniref:Histidine acid phosphatase n=1 Tax=Ancylostoma caninum TaxID=29170 RepID=A0A368GND1_ANCCA|nr:histidine acid phosphatase [Ancylostoma caninum]